MNLSVSNSSISLPNSLKKSIEVLQIPVANGLQVTDPTLLLKKMDSEILEIRNTGSVLLQVDFDVSISGPKVFEGTHRRAWAGNFLFYFWKQQYFKSNQ